MFSPILEVQKEKEIKKSTKLAFMVETKLNGALLRRILDNYFPNIKYVLTSLVNHASIYGSILGSLEFYHQGYERTFVVFETNTFDKNEINEQIEYFSEDLKEYQLEEYVTFIPITPHFQAWIRPQMKTYIEDKHDFDLFGIDPNEIPIDFEQMKKEVPDFRRFMKQVAAFVKNDKKRNNDKNGQTDKNNI